MRNVVKRILPKVQKPIPVQIVKDDEDNKDKETMMLMLKNDGYDEWCNEQIMADWDKREESPELF